MVKRRSTETVKRVILAILLIVTVFFFLSAFEALKSSRFNQRYGLTVSQPNLIIEAKSSTEEMKHKLEELRGSLESSILQLEEVSILAEEVGHSVVSVAIISSLSDQYGLDPKKVFSILDREGHKTESVFHLDYIGDLMVLMQKGYK